jgi:hypothetical protein
VWRTKRSLKIVLADTKQRVASLFGVLVIPHVFLIDRHGLLCYQGAFDDTSFRKRTPTRNYLQDALQAVMGGALPDPAKTDPYGCALMKYAPSS